MTILTNAERETHLSMNAADRSFWVVGSDDPVMQRRFEAVGATLTTQRGEWKEYTLSANHVSLRKPRELTDEQREAMAARARKMAATRHKA